MTNGDLSKILNNEFEKVIEQIQEVISLNKKFKKSSVSSDENAICSYEFKPFKNLPLNITCEMCLVPYHDSYIVLSILMDGNTFDKKTFEINLDTNQDNIESGVRTAGRNLSSYLSDRLEQ